MGVLRFPGLATGIDTAALIKQLMIINSRRLATYQVKKTDYEAQNTALSELRTKITALQSAASALADADDMEIFSASSSDKDILTVSASSDASPGSHSIEVNQLATTNTWIQDISTFDYKTDYVGAGTFIYSYNNKETTITAIADETTLEDFVNLINNDEDNPGVTASLLLQGGKYHLMLSGQETGEDYQVSINASSTEVWKADSSFTLASDNSQNGGLTTKITELSQFTINAGLQGDEVIEITGTDRYTNAITQFDLSVTSNTTLAHLMDAIEDAFDGNVKATLEEGKIVVTDKASGVSELTVSLAYNNGSGDTTLTVPTMAVYKEGAATSESLTFLDSSTFIQTQTAQNSEIKVDGYPIATAVAEVQTIAVISGNINNGNYRLTYNGQTTSVLDASADNIAAIQAAIDALSNVNSGDIVVSAVSGDPADGFADSDLTFTFSDTLGDVPMILLEDVSLGPGSPTIEITEDTKGINPWITRNSNSITDALTGITLNLHDVTEASTPIEVTVSRNTGAISKIIQNMVSAYNELIAELKSKTKYDSETKKMGILNNNIAVSFINSQARDPFIGIADGFVDTIDSFVQASDIGLSIDGAGLMEFDTDEFNDALNDDFGAVLELLGATKSGNSSSSIIQFYGASDKYTTPGTYDVEVDIDGSNTIIDVRIKLSSESTWRDNAVWPNNLVSGNSDFDDDGKPLYPENGLQFTVDSNQSAGTYTATINVKQGIAGALEDLLDKVIEVDGRLDTSKSTLDDKITAMDRRIEIEEARLTKVETRLIQKYARLERTLTMIQQQMAAVNMVSTVTFS